MDPRWRNMLAGLAVLAGLAAGARADSPGDQGRVAVLARQRNQYLQSLRSLPPLDQRRIIDVLQLQISGGHLSLTTSLTPWPDFEGRRVELDRGRLPAAVSYAQFVPNDPAARQFDFHFEEYPNDDFYGQMRVQWRPEGNGQGEITIERTQQTSRNFVRVFYSESPLVARLLVLSNDGAADSNAQNFSFAERNFVKLRQMHPAEIDQWLRPLFRLLEQDAVFAPDPNAAWQVLSGDWPVPADVHDAVLRLLPSLDDEQSRVRGRAADDLVRLGRDGATAILRLDRRGLTLEQNVRLDEVVSRFRRLSDAEVQRNAANPDFFLDCQYCPDQTVQNLAAEKLAHLLGERYRLDVSAPPSERLSKVEKLRDGIHPTVIAAPTAQP
jgi:hypothetical protein